MASIIAESIQSLSVTNNYFYTYEKTAFEPKYIWKSEHFAFGMGGFKKNMAL